MREDSFVKQRGMNDTHGSWLFEGKEAVLSRAGVRILHTRAECRFCSSLCDLGQVHSFEMVSSVRGGSTFLVEFIGLNAAVHNTCSSMLHSSPNTWWFF